MSTRTRAALRGPNGRALSLFAVLACSTPRSDPPEDAAARTTPPASQADAIDGVPIKPTLPDPVLDGGITKPSAPDGQVNPGTLDTLPTGPVDAGANPEVASSAPLPDGDRELIGRISVGDLAPVGGHSLLQDELHYIDRSRNTLMVVGKRGGVPRKSVGTYVNASGLRLLDDGMYWNSSPSDQAPQIIRWSTASIAVANQQTTLPKGEVVLEMKSQVDPPIFYFASAQSETPSAGRSFAIHAQTPGTSPKVLYRGNVRPPSGGFGLTDHYKFWVVTNDGRNQIMRGDETGSPAVVVRDTAASVNLLDGNGITLHWIEDDHEIWQSDFFGLSPDLIGRLPVRVRWRLSIYYAGNVYLFGPGQTVAVASVGRVRVLAAERPQGDFAAIGIDPSHVIWLDTEGGIWRTQN